MKWPMTSKRGFVAIAIALASFAGLAIGAASCVGEGEPETFSCPNKDVFIQNVSPYIERRCGTLDCHGQPTRPMRIYGQLGLRLPTGDPMTVNVSGGAGTTPEELEANYAAVCNLDPEAMAESAETIGASADQLLLVNKMRGKERHKGGTAAAEQSPGDRCVLLWLKFKTAADVEPECTKAVEQLK